MARAQPNDDWHQTQGRQNPGDWQALRADLVDLLNQVETQVAHKQAPGTPPRNAAAGWAPHGGQSRQREALQSVTRALERFSDRDNEDVAAAIEQIRGRHDDIPHRQPEQFGDLSSTVNNMSNRLERLGDELRHGGQSPASLRDIAEQVAQLTHVIELLAGAVGETGQVKRLEAQLANIARMVSQPQQSGDLNLRIDKLVATVEHLSDLQQQYADQPMTRLEELSSSQGKGLTAIEASVRNVYDRIDTLEQNLALSPGDLERLTQEMGTISQEMANVTQAMKGGDTSNTILARIDALNARVGQIEDFGNGGAVGGLQADIETLRHAVSDAIEPRFSALKSQIDSLDQKFGAASGNDVSASQLETQIRQLMARMDQTGEQLSDITKLYKNNAGKENGVAAAPAPDFEALAELVAQRTSEAVSRVGAQSTGLSDAGLDALEDRMTRLFAAGNEADHTQDFAGVQEGIRQVDARLARLEATLNETISSSAAPVTQPAVAPAPQPTVRPQAEAPAPSPVRAALQTASAHESRQAAPRGDALNDAMRINPVDDRPLIDPGFGADYPPEPETSFRPEARHEATAADFADAPEPEAATPPHAPVAPRPASAFDPDSVERPAKPRSSLHDDVAPAFEPAPAPRRAEGERTPRNSTNSVSRSTFIEAARRAAQREEETGTGSQSLIAKAFARFQDGKNAPEDVAEDDAPTARERKAQARAEKKARAKLKAEARRKEPDIRASADEADMPHSDFAAETRQIDDEDAPRQSFISRHRRPLLLATALVVVSLLALNLVERRLNSNDVPAAAAPAVEEPAPEPAAPAAPAASGVEQQQLLDPDPTGSVDPFTRMTMPTEAVMTQGLPAALSSNGAQDADLTRTGSIPTAAASDKLEFAPISPGVKLELPPENVGPLALREAAANGDPRAQFEIAAIYSEGQAVAQDFAASAKWYERAAAQGFAPAEYRLGNLYEHGKGVDKDLMQARLWYQRAAEAGNRMSMHNLAALYASGELGSQEFSQAAEWFERAANRGLTDSQFNLGMLYARGLGVPQNMSASYKWFSLAANQGDAGAVKARDDIARSLDAETMSRLQAEIDSWKSGAIDIKANFAPIGTWAKDFNPGPDITDRNVVEKVQAALNRLGYDVGVPDGLMGPRTREVIEEFERSTGMNESGSINPRLLAVLGSQPV
ncbi:peptidoglycan-binding protein [Mariluticola halotolerans]|uniref:peptidoglycan-binding protein n=1 Tax=Mariluticola halotolerans TaxID=2909283 RepID=UPI0026E3B6C7|nr:peptidoglycan-binding protein [Mariluticola halotolerans]UJQ93010.1 peptidoglycan-binding protein [Mariluticola halotolerans]